MSNEKMVVHKLQQGTPAWHQFRLEHFGASEAAAMLGLSKYTTRGELLKEKHTGIAKEVDDYLQSIFDKGHETEEKARAIMEETLALDLYPTTCSRGKYSCSNDGASLDHSIIFEHKLWNEELAAMVKEGIVPDSHMPQLQQILMVTGAKEVFFVVSDGTQDKLVYTIVRPSQIWFKKITNGWEQFEKDLANYTPPEVKEMPEADPIKELPMLVVEIRGEVVSSNLADFKAASDSRLSTVPKDLSSDEDFVNGKAFIKQSHNVEKRLQQVEQKMTEKNADIAAAYAMIREIGQEWRTKRLSIKKLVKRAEESRKLKIINAGRIEFAKHKELVEKTIAPIKLVITDAAIVDATRNKKTEESMKEAVSMALSQTMVAATTEGQEIEAKLIWANDTEGGNIKKYKALFGDLQEIIQKPIDDFKLVVKNRIEETVKAMEAPEPAKEPESSKEELPPAVEQNKTKKKVDDVLLANARNDVFFFANKYKGIPQLSGVLAEMQKFIKATEPEKETTPF